MSRTKKHIDLKFLRCLHKRIKFLGNPNTHRFVAYLLKLRRKVSRKYGGTNWGDNQRVDTKYNFTPKYRAMKRASRREALKQAQQQLEEYKDEVDYFRRVQIQRDWLIDVLGEPEEDFDPAGGYFD
jgi:hypothetical protein